MFQTRSRRFYIISIIRIEIAGGRFVKSFLKNLFSNICTNTTLRRPKNRIPKAKYCISVAWEQRLDVSV